MVSHVWLQTCDLLRLSVLQMYWKLQVKTDILYIQRVTSWWHGSLFFIRWRILPEIFCCIKGKWKNNRHGVKSKTYVFPRESLGFCKIATRTCIRSSPNACKKCVIFHAHDVVVWESTMHGDIYIVLHALSNVCDFLHFSMLRIYCKNNIKTTIWEIRPVTCW